MLYMNSSNKFAKAMERFKGVLKDTTSENLENIDKNELEAYQTMVQAIDAIEDVIIEQQEAFKTISEQLDKLNKDLLEKGLV